ncbi:MAG: methionyl-tRNA formyltransferase [Clostridia bacterium]|nr:methionyl-tRNA formyltransferase [Clostridia bacterium]MBQ5772166.1 methionyl-tRNA formyltransferase [Clostridia bacterium]
MRILFMGTPDFALFSLRALVEEGEDVVGVVTQPDKPKGRGYTLTPPPVKVYAEEKGLPVYQPRTLRDEAFADLLRQIDPEVIVVVAFGKILPANVLDYPKYGCVNVHGSLLPAYRGAAPMQRAIIDGCAETGITTMFMDVGLDTGDMLLKKSVAIDLHDTFETVHDKLGECGAELLLRTLALLEKGEILPEKQDDALATYAAKIEKEDCLLDFSRTAKEVHDRIRGLSPIPLSFTHTPDGRLLKILSSEPTEGKGRPGEVISLENGRITVACGEGAVALLSVLPEGKKKMSSADFINGRRISVGDILN